MAEIWTEERKKRVQELRSRGVGYAEIAKQVGAPSVSSIAGLVARLGLPPIHAEGRSIRARASYKGQGRAVRSKWFFQFGKGFVPTRGGVRTGLRDTFVMADDPTPEQRIGMLDLTRTTCRFPFGEPADITYCGRTTRDGSPYCEQHHKRCLVKPGRTR